MGLGPVGELADAEEQSAVRGGVEVSADGATCGAARVPDDAVDGGRLVVREGADEEVLAVGVGPGGVPHRIDHGVSEQAALFAVGADIERCEHGDRAGVVDVDAVDRPGSPIDPLDDRAVVAVGVAGTGSKCDHVTRQRFGQLDDRAGVGCAGRPGVIVRATGGQQRHPDHRGHPVAQRVHRRRRYRRRTVAAGPAPCDGWGVRSAR